MKLPCPKCQHDARVRSAEQTSTEVHRWLVCTNCRLKFRTVERYHLIKPAILNRPNPTTQKLQGSNNHSAVLQEQDVVRLRAMAEQGTASKDLAKTFGMSQSHVNRILRYSAWKHI